MVSVAGGLRQVRTFRQQRSEAGAGRALISLFRRAGFGADSSYRLARWCKIAGEPFAYLGRRSQATALARQAALKVPREDDYLVLPAGSLPRLQELVQYCDDLFERKREEVLARNKVPSEVIAFDRTPQGPAAPSPEELKPIVDIVCQPEYVAMAAEYIGEAPVLGNVSFWYTPVNKERSGPQNIHRDINTPRQLHLVVAIRDIDQVTGPFTFLPGDKSRAANRSLQHQSGRIADEAFWQHVSPSDMVAFTGPAGSAMLVNPYACFHFGGRAEGKPRLVLIVSYTSKYESAEEGVGAYRLINRSALSDGSKLRRLLLDLDS